MQVLPEPALLQVSPQSCARLETRVIWLCSSAKQSPAPVKYSKRIRCLHLMCTHPLWRKYAVNAKLQNSNGKQ